MVVGCCGSCFRLAVPGESKVVEYGVGEDRVRADHNLGCSGKGSRMPVKSLSLTIPDSPPYDQAGSWFESFAGNELLPLVEENQFARFWFTRYGGVGHGKHILFRFEVDDLASVESQITDLRSKFPAGPDGYKDYDYSGDIGRGERSRFLGRNSRHQDSARRGGIAFDFLHAAARLFLDCLTGPDSGGYFQLEPETTSSFSVATSMEQFHHLFCNLSGVPTFIAITVHPELPGHQVMSYEEFKGAANRDGRWQLVQRVRVGF